MPRKKQSKTIMEQHGFKDADLTTPAHDNICIWIEDHALDIISSLKPFNYSEILSDIGVSRLMGAYQLSYEQRFGDPKKEELVLDGIREKLRQYRCPPIRVDKVIWEPAILNQKSFEVGFLDLVAKVTIPEPIFDATGTEVTVTTRYKDGCKVWFEAKSSIPSLGELFRQLSFYRNYVKDPIVVVTPDTRHKDRIIQQGYYFVEAPVKKREKAPIPGVPSPLFGSMTMKKD